VNLDQDSPEVWEQLTRVEEYLTRETDLAFLAYRRAGTTDTDSELYACWQSEGDALWIVRDAIKGRTLPRARCAMSPDKYRGGSGNQPQEK
jgi:hypothetical protein